ncbi:MAG: SCO family protein [Geminicoccaceae bacterium]|nr:SCO family protein [Geminicoccaceae bacterium]MCB9943890.1 SCO family protein [Geminicoccaceae bacterium]
MKRRAALLIALLVAAIAAGLFLAGILDPAEKREQAQVPIGGPFKLVDQTGRTVTEADYAGRFMLVYFGYTYCPDICPTGLATISAAYDLLTPEEQAQLVPIFITVDPERDTPEVMAGYVSLFHPALQGLSGSPQAIASAIAAYRVYARKVEDKDRASTDYLVDHSTFAYLMDRENHYLTHFPHGMLAEDMAAKIRDYLD